MNIIATVLQAAPAAAGSGLSMWIMLALIFVIMWMFMIRPQRKQQKELEQFRAGLKKGDKIVTIGGIYGVVDSISDKYVSVRVDGDVKLRFDKTAIQKDPNSDAQ
ncbi:MAG: preprotein translocase subunit YajC [Bacteroidales bacterium]|nr:preprotein translocase subunit YajC [Bacteroidales bacterium]